MKRIAVFLDRDGTVNEEKDFLTDPAALRLIPGAAGAIRRLNDRGIVTCIVSNQSGVARGFLAEDDLVPIHARLIDELQRDGAVLDRIYYCPHHPTEGKPPYNVACDCRKPQPGMLRKAEREFGLDLSQSFVVGDRLADIGVAGAVNATPVLVLTGYGERTAKEQGVPGGTRIAPSIVEAVTFILEQVQSTS